jgi:hypothetical protein
VHHKNPSAPEETRATVEIEVRNANEPSRIRERLSRVPKVRISGGPTFVTGHEAVRLHDGSLTVAHNAIEAMETDDIH